MRRPYVFQLIADIAPPAFYESPAFLIGAAVCAVVSIVWFGAYLVGRSPSRAKSE